MAVHVCCPQCGATQRVASEGIGKQFRCGKCREAFVALTDNLAPAPPAAVAGAPVTDERSQPARRRPPIALAALVLVLLVCGLALGWVFTGGLGTQWPEGLSFGALPTGDDDSGADDWRDGRFNPPNNPSAPNASAKGIIHVSLSQVVADPRKYLARPVIFDKVYLFGEVKKYGPFFELPITDQNKVKPSNLRFLAMPTPVLGLESLSTDFVPVRLFCVIEQVFGSTSEFNAKVIDVKPNHQGQFPSVGQKPIHQAPVSQCPLDDTVADVAVGGGGRFLLLHLAGAGKLALFDVKERKVVHHFPLARPDVKFAAGRDKLVIAWSDAAGGHLERYDLSSRNREAAAPFTGHILNLTLGADADGPAMIRWATYAAAGDKGEGVSSIDLLDVKTLRPVGQAVVWATPAEYKNFLVRDVVHFRAAAHGYVFGAWCGSRNPQGIFVYEAVAQPLIAINMPVNGGAILPGVEGATLFTTTGAKAGHLGAQRGVPSAQGNYFLTVHAGTGGEGPSADIYLDAQPPVLLHSLMVDAEVRRPDGDTDDFTNDKRFHLLPRDHLLITIPPARDRLILYEVDTAKLLGKAPHYLFAVATPPLRVAPGMKVVHKLSVESKLGGVTCELASGPPGAKVSADGTFTWTVPPGAPPTTKVSVTIHDAGDNTVTHWFRMNVPAE